MVWCYGMFFFVFCFLFLFFYQITQVHVKIVVSGTNYGNGPRITANLSDRDLTRLMKFSSLDLKIF